MESPTATLRLFFALTPVATQSAALAECATPLIAQLQAQRVPPENFHATLCFLGAVAPERLAPLREVVAGIRGRSATLQFDVLDYWSKPGVLCATTSDNSLSESASVLAQQLGAASTAAGFSPDIKPFRAHVTVARKVQRAAAAAYEWPQPLTAPVVVNCDRFVLMESRRGESGSIYSVVESWPLYA